MVKKAVHLEFKMLINTAQDISSPNRKNFIKETKSFENVVA